MADQSLLLKTETFSTGSGDFYYLVQGGADRRIDFDNLPFISPTQSSDITENNGKVSFSGITETANTSTIINLSNVIGNLCNMASANATTTYTLTGTVTGGNARVLINAASEPIITGATNITGSDFIISTDMYLVVFNNGNVTQFWFEEI